jgi:oligopeptidase B
MIRDVEQRLAELDAMQREGSPEGERIGEYWYYGTLGPEGRSKTYRNRVKQSDEWSADLASIPEDSKSGELLVDDYSEASQSAYYQRGGIDVSASGSVYCYTFDAQGEERYTLRIRGAEPGPKWMDSLYGVSRLAYLDSLGNNAYYLSPGRNGRPAQVRCHRVGTLQETDSLVYEEQQDDAWISLSPTRDRSYLRIISYSADSSVTLTIRLDTVCDADPLPVRRRRPGTHYGTELVRVGEARMMAILSPEHQGARQLEILSSEAGAWGKSGVEICGIPIFGRIMTIHGFHEGTVAVHQSDDSWRLLFAPSDEGPRAHAMEFRVIEQGPASDSLVVHPAADWKCPYLEYSTSGIGKMPERVRLDLRKIGKGERQSIRARAVTGGVNRPKFESDRLICPGQDGMGIPATYVSSAPRGSRSPGAGLVLYVYGSYGLGVGNGFAPDFAFLLESGVDVAIAHVRGGGELGRKWHREGRGRKKVQAVRDYLSVLRYLKHERLVGGGGVIAMGASAGGVVAGAALNWVPEEFSGAVLVAPLISPLRAVQRPSDIRAATDRTEFGDPTESEEEREALERLSPLENVACKDYPPIYLALNEQDARINNGDALEWARALRTLGTDVTVDMRTGTGHVGGSGSDAPSRARLLAWVIDRIGVAGPLGLR